jgi:hypothetical protein
MVTLKHHFIWLASFVLGKHIDRLQNFTGFYFFSEQDLLLDSSATGLLLEASRLSHPHDCHGCGGLIHFQKLRPGLPGTGRPMGLEVTQFITRLYHGPAFAISPAWWDQVGRRCTVHYCSEKSNDYDYTFNNNMLACMATPCKLVSTWKSLYEVGTCSDSFHKKGPVNESTEACIQANVATWQKERNSVVEWALKRQRNDALRLPQACFDEAPPPPFRNFQTHTPDYFAQDLRDRALCEFLGRLPASQAPERADAGAEQPSDLAGFSLQDVLRLADGYAALSPYHRKN